MYLDTRIIHAGAGPDALTGAIATPIYQTSNFALSLTDVPNEYVYSRNRNPTRDALERRLAILENGQSAFCFSSGVAAIDAVLRLCKPGDEVLVSEDLYGGTYRLMSKLFEPTGVMFRYISLTNPACLPDAVGPNTQLVWIETPSNPLLRLIDIRGVATALAGTGCKLVVDNTFASPYLQNPLDMGAHIVVHSISKYIAGHSDLIMGAVITTDENTASQLSYIQNACGAIPGPQDCFLALRGLQTLHLRMQRQCENAMQIAQYLSGHNRCYRVHYPGLITHEGHTIARQQMRMYGGVVALELVSPTDVKALLNRFKLFTIAESLGGVESLCSHPATMSHAVFPPALRYKMGITDSLIRLSIGIEDIHDLLADLALALD